MLVRAQPQRRGGHVSRLVGGMPGQRAVNRPCDGPSAISRAVMDYVSRALEAVADWRAAAGPMPSHPALTPDPARFEAAWAEFGERMAGSYPFHHPRYAGQMLKPPHPVAIAAYTAALHVNANNHALDGGPVTSELEVEVMRDLATMFGFPADALGHLTSSGTIANLEALWVARELHPEKAIAFGTDAHYTHSRMCAVLGVEGVATDDIEAAAAAARWARSSSPPARPALGHGRRRRATAVALRERYGVRIHVDAAYGGFFALLDDSSRCDVLPRDRRRRQRRRRPAQARPAALRLRRGAVPRPGRRAPLQARLALHLLHLRRPAPGRDLARVLTRGRGRRGAVADAALARPQADPGGRRARRPRLGGAAARVRRAAPARRARCSTSSATTRAAARCRRSTPPARACSTPAWRPRTPSTCRRCASSADAFPPDVERDADGARVLRSVLMKPEHEPHVPWLHERVTELATAVSRP